MVISDTIPFGFRLLVGPMAVGGVDASSVRCVGFKNASGRLFVYNSVISDFLHVHKLHTKGTYIYYINTTACVCDNH